MSTLYIASSFDNREAIARDGEIEPTNARSVISDAEKRRRERLGDAELKTNGYDVSDGRPLSAAEHPAKEDIMTRGRRVSERRAGQPEFVSEAKLNNGGQLHAEPEAAIDEQRRYRVAWLRYCQLLTESGNDQFRYSRIDEGLRLLVLAQSDFEIDTITGAIHRDCKILGIATPAGLALAMGCSTSTVYTRMRDGSLTAAMVAIAAERDQSVADARQSRNHKLDIKLATRGTMFDSPAWHREIERLYTSQKYRLVSILIRETTLSRFAAQKGADRAIRMLPQSRIEKLAELNLLTAEVCHMLGKMSEAERDGWLAQRDGERIEEICGNASQRRKCSGQSSSKDYARRIKQYLEANERNPNGPTLPKPNVPRPLAQLTKAKNRSSSGSIVRELVAS